ncbi:MAG: TIGR03364 family FAD-dependent oxidoreductase [Cryobacterium sp.]|nr:TIGR03364 family FAD-dependent oxidoreductase [Cryobacterium sp.]
MTEHYDLAVVGAGIVGLGHAAAGLDRGLRVVVVERDAMIAGASVRNFGHVGTSVHVGEAGEYAIRARAAWLRLADHAGFWLRRSGSLMVARHHDELAVLEEAGGGELLTAEQVAGLAPVMGAVGGMLQHGDLQVDPREAAPAIAAWLALQGVEFQWRTTALFAETGVLHTSRGEIRAEAIVFAVNYDVDHVFPEVAERNGIERCALDMLLSDGVGLPLPLLTGSSMLRYSAFATQPSAAAVRERIARDEPSILTLDVNHMLTERPDGTLIVGDTHTVGTAISPFQNEGSFGLLERLTADLFGIAPRIRERWQGVYAKAPRDFLRAAPAEGMRVVSVTTGIGMTTGLGLAEAVVEELFG